MLYGFNNEYRMFFVKQEEPQEVHKPIVIAAMQDMGNVGSIAIEVYQQESKNKTFQVCMSAVSQSCDR